MFSPKLRGSDLEPLPEHIWDQVCALVDQIAAERRSVGDVSQLQQIIGLLQHLSSFTSRLTQLDAEGLSRIINVNFENQRRQGRSLSSPLLFSTTEDTSIAIESLTGGPSMDDPGVPPRKRKSDSSFAGLPSPSLASHRESPRVQSILPRTPLVTSVPMAFTEMSPGSALGKSLHSARSSFSGGADESPSLSIAVSAGASTGTGVSVPVQQLQQSLQRRKGRKPAPTSDQQHCLQCFAVETPEWRSGPQGKQTLCNACGLQWAKSQKKKLQQQHQHQQASQQDGQAAAAAGPIDPSVSPSLASVTPTHTPSMRPGSASQNPDMVFVHFTTTEVSPHERLSAYPATLRRTGSGSARPPLSPHGPPPPPQQQQQQSHPGPPAFLSPHAHEQQSYSTHSPSQQQLRGPMSPFPPQYVSPAYASSMPLRPLPPTTRGPPPPPQPTPSMSFQSPQQQAPSPQQQQQQQLASSQSPRVGFGLPTGLFPPILQQRMPPFLQQQQQQPSQDPYQPHQQQQHPQQQPFASGPSVELMLRGVTDFIDGASELHDPPAVGASAASGGPGHSSSSTAPDGVVVGTNQGLSMNARMVQALMSTELPRSIAPRSLTLPQPPPPAQQQPPPQQQPPQLQQQQQSYGAARPAPALSFDFGSLLAPMPASSPLQAPPVPTPPSYPVTPQHQQQQQPQQQQQQQQAHGLFPAFLPPGAATAADHAVVAAVAGVGSSSVHGGNSLAASGGGATALGTVSGSSLASVSASSSSGSTSRSGLHPDNDDVSIAISVLDILPRP